MTPERIERAIANSDSYVVETIVDFALVGDPYPGRHVDDAITAAVRIARAGYLGSKHAKALGIGWPQARVIIACVAATTATTTAA